MSDQRNTGVGEAPSEEQQPTNGPAAAAAATEDLEKLRAERDEFKDLLLRKTAEFENYRRRSEKERRELSDYVAADVLTEFLPLLDNLERALGSAADAANASDPSAALTAYRAGVEMIRRQFLDLLKRKGVTPIDALGADFDPHFHQAVSREASETHRDGEVMEELQRGYKLGDRLLRPAMVKVATRE